MKSKVKLLIKTTTLWTPLFGIVAFIGLYLFSSSLYPGGSIEKPFDEGFNWLYNFWCDLLSKQAINGELNPARPYAMIGMFTLSTSLFVFFWRLGKAYEPNKKLRIRLQVSAGISMGFASLLFTDYHDELIIASSLTGLVLLRGIIRIFTDADLRKFKVGGLLCLFLILLNNVLYYLDIAPNILPLVQKVTFLVVFAWVIGLNFKMNK